MLVVLQGVGWTNGRFAATFSTRIATQGWALNKGAGRNNAHIFMSIFFFIAIFFLPALL